MEPRELIRMGENFVRNLLKDKGRVIPQMLIHVRLDDDSLDVIGMPVTDADSVKQQGCRKAIIGMIRKCRERKIFQGALMVSEAWMAAVHKGSFDPEMRAKDHPDRKEVIVISAWTDLGKLSMMWDLTGKEGDKIRTLNNKIHEFTDFGSWINSAFEVTHENRTRN